MMKRQSKLLKETKALIVLCVSKSLTMLEHAQSTGLSLLNRLKEEVDDLHIAEPTKVFGCKFCAAIYEIYFYQRSQKLGVTEMHCPGCTREDQEFLGPLPQVSGCKGEYFLVDDCGNALGPFQDEDDAQNNLWRWFRTEKKHGNSEEEAADQEDHQKRLRLVAKDGVSLEEDDERLH